CPFCSPRGMPTGRKVSDVPGLLAEWDPEKNIDRDPHRLSAGSKIRVWWRCKKGNEHSWRTTPYNRSKLGHSCPFCSKERLRTAARLVSIARPELVKDWDRSFDPDFLPENTTVGSSRVVRWVCRSNSNHVWQATVSSRALQKRGCPFC